MKKLINDPYVFVDEVLDGIVRAHPEQLRLVGPDKRAVVRADAPIQGKVAICILLWREICWHPCGWK